MKWIAPESIQVKEFVMKITDGDFEVRGISVIIE